MRILTVRQPWAWAIIHGGKDVENRTRNIAGDYRGPVAIHAGMSKDADAHRHPLIMSTWQEHRDSYFLHFGAIIGVVDLADVHSADECWDRDKSRLIALYRSGPEGRAEVSAMPDDGPGGIIGKTRFCSPWAMDEHHHLVLANPRPLAEPIPYRGAPGLRKLDADTIARIEAAL